MKLAMRIGALWMVVTGLLAGGCTFGTYDDGSMTNAQRAEQIEKLRLVIERHMPCQAEAVAAVLDEYLGNEVLPASAELVPIRNDAENHWAWVIRVGGRTRDVLTAAPSGPATRPIGGPASEALGRARRFIAEYFERRGMERGKEEQPIPSERLTGEYQERVHGVQIVAFDLDDPQQMLWKVTAKPVGKKTLGGEIWMRFTPKSHIGAEYGR